MTVIDEYKNYIAGLAGEKTSLTVVLDMGNGTTCGVAPELYRALGYNVIELYGTPDGTFPNRNPNPANFENIKALCANVVENHADFGVAFDGDGDRAVFVDNLGRPLINEKALIILYESISRRLGAGSVVYDQKCSRIVKDTIEKMGGTAILERSGHAFIKRCFIKNNSVLAGEISGHFFFRELGHDDGMYAGIRLGQCIAESGRTLAQLADEIPDPFVSPDLRYKVPYDRMDGILEAIKKDYSDERFSISTYDGVRVETEQWWFLVRRSVTEQAMTVKIEADSCEMLEKIKDELVSKYFK